EPVGGGHRRTLHHRYHAEGGRHHHREQTHRDEHLDERVTRLPPIAPPARAPVGGHATVTVISGCAVPVAAPPEVTLNTPVIRRQIFAVPTFVPERAVIVRWPSGTAVVLNPPASVVTR